MSNPNRIATINLPAPSRVGQATAVEQSRAVAEVHAAMVMAQQVPRNIDQAIAEMERSCRQMGLAERAFYAFPRGGQTVSGPSIHMARELARCWGNIQHGLHEMRRDDEAHQSEMQAFAWDVEKNTRVASTFIVPHKRAANQVLTDMRDIYENNTNNGSRRVREAIFAVLPPWFVERAKDLCNQTLEAAVEKQGLPQRIQEAVKAYAGGGITQQQLEEKLGKPVAEWDAADVTQLDVLFRSLRRREVTKEEAFPSASQKVTPDEIAASPSAQPPAPPTPADNPAADTTDSPTPQQEDPPAAPQSADVDTEQILALIVGEWEARGGTKQQLTGVFRKAMGVGHREAAANKLQAFLAQLREGKHQPAGGAK
ncbi:hypothetical protein [Nonomuraea turcica]|uniref:hypothetical protein n=1 Tax=Nonomuraea sp. G32 TaxID=3067274 RepID=UPI00273C7399|nr:hypothetical protein [Nonomuraea sp. G32]MDP4501014.1 hypothetical protein [Nonomuraea sp. G32]